MLAPASVVLYDTTAYRALPGATPFRHARAYFVRLAGVSMPAIPGTYLSGYVSSSAPLIDAWSAFACSTTVPHAAS